jgi:hypothetical protein
MKCGLTNTVLTFVLGVFAVAGVLLVLRTVIQTRELQTINAQASYLSQAQMLLNDVAAYNQKNPSPELAKLLQPIQSRQAGAK